MNDRPSGLVDRLQRYIGGMKSSTLFMVVSGLFLLDVAIPDPLPFVDEVVLGILTILIARWRNRYQAPPPPPKPPPRDVTPPGAGEGG